LRKRRLWEATNRFRVEVLLPSGFGGSLRLDQLIGEILEEPGSRWVQVSEGDKTIVVLVECFPKVPGLALIAHLAADPAEVKEGDATLALWIQRAPSTNRSPVPGEEGRVEALLQFLP
jgi:hypothetical protein